MCGNTRPKLLEVSYGKDVTTQHDKGLVTTRSPHCTNLEHARHGGFQTLDVEHRTDSRRPLDQPPGTTTESDEDKNIHTKTEADEDRLTLGMSEVAAPLQLTTTPE